MSNLDDYARMAHASYRTAPLRRLHFADTESLVFLRPTQPQPVVRVRWWQRFYRFAPERKHA